MSHVWIMCCEQKRFPDYRRVYTGQNYQCYTSCLYFSLLNTGSLEIYCFCADPYQAYETKWEIYSFNLFLVIIIIFLSQFLFFNSLPGFVRSQTSKIIWVGKTSWIDVYFSLGIYLSSMIFQSLVFSCRLYAISISD